MYTLLTELNCKQNHSSVYEPQSAREVTKETAEHYPENLQQINMRRTETKAAALRKNMKI